MSRFNPLDHPAILSIPESLTAISAWHGHIPFVFFLLEAARPRILVELGVHLGDSYCAFCQAIAALKLPTQAYGIDTFKGDEQTGFYGPEFLANLREYHDPRYGGFSTLVPSTFAESAQRFDAGEIDVLHIDGLHTYEAVAEDFATWLPKMSSRGIVLLHDIASPDPSFGTPRFWAEIAPQYPSFAFDHSNGLGVLAAGEVPEMLAPFFDPDLAEEHLKIRRFFSALGGHIAYYRSSWTAGAEHAIASMGMGDA